VDGRVTIQKIMPLLGLSLKLRLSRSLARLRFQDRPSVAILCGNRNIILNLSKKNKTDYTYTIQHKSVNLFL
jgi:hypothetical protein